jgi:hypothetical protein
MTLPFRIVGLCDTREYKPYNSLTIQAPFGDGRNLSHPLAVSLLIWFRESHHIGV